MECVFDGQRVSQIGMAIAVERLLRGGFAVAVPLMDEGYDLLAFHGRKFWRIQVKATSCSGKNRRRVALSCGYGRRGRYKDDGSVDAFIAVHVRTGAFVCMSIKEVAGRSWINFSAAATHGDVSALLKIKPKRC